MGLDKNAWHRDFFVASEEKKKKASCSYAKWHVDYSGKPNALANADKVIPTVIGVWYFHQKAPCMFQIQTFSVGNNLTDAHCFNRPPTAYE